MPKYGSVVADASPLISLEKVPAGFSLLAYTCSTLIVPEAVVGEVSFFLPKGDDYFERHDIRRYIDVEIVPASDVLIEEHPELNQLGPGERFAIALASSRRVPLLLEERRARRLAREAGLRVFGAAAVIKIAMEEKGIDFHQATSFLRDLFLANRINRKVLDRMLEALRQ